MNTSSATDAPAVSDDDLRGLVADGLLALKAGGRLAAQATDEIQDSASHPDLKQALKKGEETSKEWRARVDRAMDEFGVEGEGDNPIIEAHVDVSRRIREEASTDGVRDLGIIASGQLALHYWIAAFGTLGAYAKNLGKTSVAQSMSQCVDEARQADEQHTKLAKTIMGADA